MNWNIDIEFQASFCIKVKIVVIDIIIHPTIHIPIPIIYGTYSPYPKIRLENNAVITELELTIA